MVIHPFLGPKHPGPDMQHEHTSPESMELSRSLYSLLWIQSLTTGNKQGSPLVFYPSVRRGQSCRATSRLPLGQLGAHGAAGGIVVTACSGYRACEWFVTAAAPVLSHALIVHHQAWDFLSFSLASHIGLLIDYIVWTEDTESLYFHGSLYQPSHSTRFPEALIRMCWLVGSWQ